MALAGKNADIFLTAATATTSLAASFSAVAGSSLSFQIDATAQRHWTRDPSVAGRPIVSVGGSTTALAFTVNYVQGIVTFASTPPGAVTADVEYVTASQYGGGREWSLNVDRDLFEVSEFGGGGWREFIDAFQSASVSIANYWEDSSIVDRIVVDQDVIVKLYPDRLTAGSTNDRYDGYAYITSDQIGADVEGIIGESVEFQIDGALYWTTE